MIKKSIVLSIIIAVSLILFACGNNESTSAVEEDVQESTPMSSVLESESIPEMIEESSEMAEEMEDIEVSDLDSVLGDNYTYKISIKMDSDETGMQNRELIVYRYQSKLVYWIDDEYGYFMDSDANEVGIYTKSTNSLTTMSGDMFDIDDVIDEGLYAAQEDLDVTSDMYLRDDTFDGNKVKVYNQTIGSQSVTAYYNPENMLLVKVDYEDENITTSYELTEFSENTVTEEDVAYPADATVSDMGDYTDMLNEYSTME